MSIDGMKLKYDSTVNLGHILQIIALVFTAVTGIWWISARQSEILVKDAQLEKAQYDQEQEIKKLTDTFVRKDVNSSDMRMLMDKLELISSEVFELRSDILSPGVPGSKRNKPKDNDN